MIGPAASAADTLELEGGGTAPGKLYVIRDGYHYVKIHRNDVERVRYGAGRSKTDVIVLKQGTSVEGRITAYVDDEYYIRIPSGRIKGISSGRQPAESPRVAARVPEKRESFVLRIRGSNTIGSKLAPALAAAYLRKLGASRIEEQLVRSEEQEVRGYFPGAVKPAVIEIHSHGSATAFSCLEKRLCDIGASSRKIEKKEADRLIPLGDMTDPKNEHVIGLDGIAVIVNKRNPVFRMSRDEIRKVFSGEISDWAQLGGKAGRINIYARDDKSGTWDTFKGIVLGKKGLAAKAGRYEDSVQLSGDVSKDINAIGFIGLPYVLDAKAVAVSDGGAPVPPDRFSIATEDYPLSRRLFFYTPSKSDNPHVGAFAEFAHSEEGQAIVARIGFVDMNVRAETPQKTADFSRKYAELRSGAERLSVNFRFRPNSFEPDTKAVRDIKRVAKTLRGAKNRGRKALLFGFTDDLGSEADNLALSEKRAYAIRKELNRQGVRVSEADVIGFGKLNPVASNATEEGRRKNRRVEIWIR
jgi:phosphate transport system substrate-binding protein